MGKVVANKKLSIIFLCRNEERAIGRCILHAKQVIDENSLDADILISDSSSDKSPSIAKELGAKVIKHDKLGYGNAILEGVRSAKTEYVAICDGDCSYDLNRLPLMIRKLDEGYDLVLGNRFAGKMDSGAMPNMHKYLGNPALSFIFRLFFGTDIKDTHSGIRVFKKSAFDRLPLYTTGMEFASEMLIKAVRARLRILEIPADYHRRIGKSKLRSFQDGWKHLRFMLLYSPKYLFFYPGTILFFVGLTTLFWFYLGSPVILGKKLFYHPMFISSLMTIAGSQIIIFAVFAKAYSITHLNEPPGIYRKIFRYFSIERSIIIGCLIIMIGALSYGLILSKWISSSFGDLNEIKTAVLGLTIITIGIQFIFSSFMLSILGIKER